jgi:hypothetical protein
MARRTTRMRREAKPIYQVPRGSQVVVTDALWTWSKRSLTTAGAIGGALWYIFQFYTQVQTLKDKVDALWAGQSTIMQSIAEIKSGVAAIAQQPAKKGRSND